MIYVNIKTLTDLSVTWIATDQSKAAYSTVYQSGVHFKYLEWAHSYSREFISHLKDIKYVV